MSPRPPTLRENRRYILARIEPAGSPADQKELYYAIADAVASLWGDSVAGIIKPAVVAAENGHVFIRCLRGTEKELLVALSTVTGCREVRLALRPVAVSGTMESLRERIRDRPAPDGSVSDTGGHMFDRKEVIALYCNGQKVDVIEKGFKNAHRLFLTRSDLENS